ncbi:Uncharacterized protein TCM_011812 [Theobroma cacao]|uniref:Uncharacterized protein n=1 Tax=Theobroma cacao TaxID=3641 RepID=A0A061EAQ1_THECC|nr:Uncharacterized protein TCM_011812 [Theobroma cacao]
MLWGKTEIIGVLAGRRRQWAPRQLFWREKDASLPRSLHHLPSPRSTHLHLRTPLCLLPINPTFFQSQDACICMHANPSSCNVCDAVIIIIIIIMIH